MSWRALLVLIPVLAGSNGCRSNPAVTTDTADPVALEELSDAQAVDALRASILAVQARPERDVETIRVQHILVGHVDSPRLVGVTRTRAEAEALTARLLLRIQGGEDFDALVREYTNDAHPGIYGMTTGAPTESGTYARRAMVPAFGDVGWRLDVGEVGVAPEDSETSPYGWHLIKRLE